MTNRLRPIAEPFQPDVATALAAYPQQDGYILSLFRTFANSLRFLRKGVPNLLDRESPLSLRIREIVILRVTANKNCEYEWGVHVSIFAAAAKFSQAQIEATRSGPIDPDLWSEPEAYLLKAIDSLCSTGRIEDDVITQFETDWTKEQQLEIFALCGAYHTISFVANTARLPNEPFGALFP
ncbi:MAG: carboxymuconolactone decarboxylase [Alphaproteobacteria bacterium PA3]|nr:MAG: carboxymuconolactone decarboxylase [Alphaproteobacteria bacterium PA3]